MVVRTIQSGLVMPERSITHRSEGAEAQSMRSDRGSKEGDSSNRRAEVSEQILATFQTGVSVEYLRWRATTVAT